MRYTHVREINRQGWLTLPQFAVRERVSEGYVRHLIAQQCPELCFVPYKKTGWLLLKECHIPKLKKWSRPIA